MWVLIIAYMGFGTIEAYSPYVYQTKGECVGKLSELTNEEIADGFIPSPPTQEYDGGWTFDLKSKSGLIKAITCAKATVQ